jgi:hypothetical protein
VKIVIYLITYSINNSDNKLGQIDAEDYGEAKDKIENIFTDLSELSGRKYSLIDIKRLSEIRRLDALN